MIEDEVKQKKRQKMIRQILNHQVQGEAFILTDGTIWKTIVLNHFNKVQRGEITTSQLIELLEKKYSIKYAQKYSLVQYPIEEFLLYISKVSKKPLHFGDRNT